MTKHLGTRIQKDRKRHQSEAFLEDSQLSQTTEIQGSATPFLPVVMSQKYHFGQLPLHNPSLLAQEQAPMNRQRGPLAPPNISSGGNASAIARKAVPAEEAIIGLEGGPLPSDLVQRLQASNAGGSHLAESVRAPLEQAMGTDFSEVRIHDNTEAHDLALNMGAHAFTNGNHIYLGREARLEEPGLLPHELTHVVQQRGIDQSGPMAVGAADTHLEQEAEGVSKAITSAPSTAMGGLRGGSFGTPTHQAGATALSDTGQVQRMSPPTQKAAPSAGTHSSLIQRDVDQGTKTFAQRAAQASGGNIELFYFIANGWEYGDRWAGDGFIRPAWTYLQSAKDAGLLTDDTQFMLTGLTAMFTMAGLFGDDHFNIPTQPPPISVDLPGGERISLTFAIEAQQFFPHVSPTPIPYAFVTVKYGPRPANHLTGSGNLAIPPAGGNNPQQAWALWCLLMCLRQHLLPPPPVNSGLKLTIPQDGLDGVKLDQFQLELPKFELPPLKSGPPKLLDEELVPPNFDDKKH